MKTLAAGEIAHKTANFPSFRAAQLAATDLLQPATPSFSATWPRRWIPLPRNTYSYNDLHQFEQIPRQFKNIRRFVS
jgi:hypothetical protein